MRLFSLTGLPNEFSVEEFWTQTVDHKVFLKNVDQSSSKLVKKIPNNKLDQFRDGIRTHDRSKFTRDLFPTNLSLSFPDNLINQFINQNWRSNQKAIPQTKSQWSPIAVDIFNKRL
jgi:hypothetical protein